MSPQKTYNLGELAWTVSGYIPTAWMAKSMELGFAMEPEIPAVPVNVPGSVQGALRAAGVLPDWFVGLNSRDCEWIEHREWMFTATLPDEWFTDGSHVVLNCDGLDGNGVVVFNSKRIGTFNNAFIPYQFDLTEDVRPTENKLHLIFELPPRWLGQVGYTSQMKDWKPRFNYTWDWIPRIVQIGPWEPVTLQITNGAEIESFRCRSDYDLAHATGTLWLKGSSTGSRVSLMLRDGETVLRSVILSTQEFTTGVEWSALPVAAWWPNGAGSQPLYTITAELHDDNGTCLDVQQRTIGFKHIDWQACAGAPIEADPWICVVNGQPIFLQGVDWTPILPTFADLTEEDYRKLIEQYVALGCNIFRVWGGAFLEKEWFYQLCDKHGILIWQEFSLSSSGHENWPHEDELSMSTLVQIAESYIIRRQHHAALLMWCGGNELQEGTKGSKTGVGIPVTMDHPLMQRWQALVTREDPGRRFMPSSASGPRFIADMKEFGQGLNWDVHGPWNGPGETPEDWAAYWQLDDALFRSETGAPGACGADIIQHYAGGLAVTPGTMDSPLWRRFYWWLEWEVFIKEQGHEPESLEEYVTWSQARQSTILSLAVGSCKARFPGIGGVILWMGHDCFPCATNTSIIDFWGRPKPAALAVAKIFRDQ